MFQSFANYKPFANTQNANRSAGGGDTSSMAPGSSLAAQSDQPQNTGGPITNTMVNKGYDEGKKYASSLMGGSSDDAKSQLMQGLADKGNPVAQSAVTPAGSSMKDADPQGAAGASGADTVAGVGAGEGAADSGAASWLAWL